MLTFPALLTGFVNTALVFFALGLVAVPVIRNEFRFSWQSGIILYIAVALLMETSMRFAVFLGNHSTFWHVFVVLQQLLLPLMLLGYTYRRNLRMIRVLGGVSLLYIAAAAVPGLLFSSEAIVVRSVHLGLAEGPLMPAAAGLSFIAACLVYVRVLLRLRSDMFFPGVVPVMQSVIITILTMLLWLGYAQLGFPGVLPEPVPGSFLAVWYALIIVFSIGWIAANTSMHPPAAALPAKRKRAHVKRGAS